METNHSSKPKAFLTGMKPGQSWEDFVNSLTSKLDEQGYFAPETPEAQTPSPTENPSQEQG